MRDKTIFKTVASGDVVGGSTTPGVLAVATDVLVCETREITNIVASAIVLNNAGTATVVIEASFDKGVTWAPVTGGSLTNASFASGNNQAVALGVSDARGMQMQAAQVRARLAAVSGGWTGSLAVSGLLLGESR